MTHLTAEELATVDAFVRHVVRANAFWVVVGNTSIAQVDSQRHAGAAVNLLWSSHTEATRWADLLAVHPVVEEGDLATLLGEFLPWLSRSGAIVGPDWSAEPAEPEVTADDLAQRFREQLVEAFVADAQAEQAVWLLQGDSGPGVFPAPDNGGMVLPVWGTRAGAERCLVGDWAAMRPFRMTLREFLTRVLTACAGSRARIAPNHVPGAGTPILQPWGLKSRLGENGQAERRIA
jgi:hypothetical protein